MFSSSALSECITTRHVIITNLKAIPTIITDSKHIDF